MRETTEGSKKAGRRLLNIIATTVIVLGLGLLCYPQARVVYYNYKEAKLIEGWQQSLQLLAESPIGDVTLPDDNDTSAQAEGTAALNSADMVGMLQIDKIGLISPVLRGTTKENLNIALATIEPTGTAGEVGNYAIAGHNSLNYGRHFNRLDELKKGDSIVLNDLLHKYTYTVTEKLYVQPDKVDVLYPSGAKALLTLVTCHPRETAKQRLIIRAELTE